MLRTVMCGSADDFIQHRYQGIVAFEAETLLADKGFVQEGLELFYLDQPLQQLFALIVVQRRGELSDSAWLLSQRSSFSSCTCPNS